LAPASNPSKKRPMMNMSESSIRLLAMTTASSIRLHFWGDEINFFGFYGEVRKSSKLADPVKKAFF